MDQEKLHQNEKELDQEFMTGIPIKWASAFLFLCVLAFALLVLNSVISLL